MVIDNLTNPGIAPVTGDLIRITYPSGATEKKVFTDPAALSPDILIDPCEWLIDIGPFFDRFGASKMPVLKSQDADTKAFVMDAMSRKWIDLKRADVAQALLYLVSLSLITASQETTILTTPVTLDENRALRALYFR